MLVSAGLLAATTPRPALAQAPPIAFKGDLLARLEGTENLFTNPCAECHTVDPKQRGRFQFRPRIEARTLGLRLIAGLELNYSSDTNTRPTDVTLSVRPIRDNYDSRGVRIDLASLGVDLSPNLELDAGRMVMPFRVTEMLWDRDLRVQGATAKWTLLSDKSGLEALRLSAVYSRGSHVFRDSAGSFAGSGTTLAGVSVDFGVGSLKRADLTASYLRFDHTEYLEAVIRRQNTRSPSGAVGQNFGVIDLVGRFRWDMRVPLQAVVNYAINHRAVGSPSGLWAAFVAGSFRDGRLRGEYTYATVDRDLTLAAYAGDDFFWGTGWAGHRVDLGFAPSPSTSFHVIGQWQRFKETADPVEGAWIQRWRLEARRVF
jgi:hypothetical protein